MTSILKADNIQDADGNNIINESSNTITIGASGDTISIPSGATFNINGTAGTGIGTNTPAFEAQMGTSAQSVSDATVTKVQFSVENFDTDNCYDHSTNYRFTPNVAGKYFVYGLLLARGTGTETGLSRIYIYKNSSIVAVEQFDPSTNRYNNASRNIQAIVDMNGSSDYIEMHGLVDTTGSTTQFYNDSDNRTIFGAFKLIT